MGGLHYQMRANSLRSKGLPVYEFGNRALREGCFGEDVLQLQNWLAEESYYNPVDGGYTGYFGSVTKEALQAWQRDAEIEVTGVFDGPSRWAYLRSVEKRAREKQSMNSNQLVVGVEPSTEAAVPQSSMLQASIKDAPGSSFIIIGLTLTVLAAVGIIKRTFTSRRRPMTKDPMVSGSGYVPGNPAPPLPAPTALHARPEPKTNIKNRKSVPPSQTGNPKKLKRLSEDELQRYIAPMKGSSSGRSPVQRPAPRPLVLGEGNKNVNLPEDAVVSRHGMYYGGKQVLDRVKQFLAEENGDVAPIGSAAQRLMQLGYDMRNSMNRSLKKEDAKRGTQKQNSTPPNAPAPRQDLPSQRSATASFEDIPDGSSSEEESYIVDPEGDSGNSSNGASTMPGMLSSQSTTLLAGTELEAAPERGIRPVQVQRGKPVRSPLGGANSRRDSAPKLMPVPVVKPGVGASSTNASQSLNGEENQKAIDPNATIVLNSKPVKLHKPARLASRQYDNSDDE